MMRIIGRFYTKTAKIHISLRVSGVRSELFLLVQMKAYAGLNDHIPELHIGSAFLRYFFCRQM